MKAENKAPLKKVVGHDWVTSASGLSVRVDVLECGHREPSSLGTTGYADSKRKRCYSCQKENSKA